MTPLLARCVAAILLVAATLAACTPAVPSPPAMPTAVTTADPSPEPTAPEPTEPQSQQWTLLDGEGTAVTIRELSAADAAPAVEGVEYEVVERVPGGDPAEGYVDVGAIGPDGTLYGSAIPPDNYSGGDWLEEHGQVGEWVAGTFAPFADTGVLVEGDHPRQTYAIDVLDGWVAWAETESTNLFVNEWRMFVRSPDGDVVLVARSEEINESGLPIVDGDDEPVLAAGRLYWSTAYPTAANVAEVSDDWSMQVVSRALDGSDTIRVELREASRPARAADGVYVARTGLGDAPASQHRSTISHLAADGTVIDLLGYGPAGALWPVPVSDGGLLVIKVGVPDESRGGMSDGWLDLLETDGTVTRIQEDGPIGGDVVVCGARVAWTTAYGNGDSDAPLVVYDAATGDLWRIDEPHQYGRLMCAGDYLTFTQLFPDTDLTAATTVIRWTAP